ncbi:response regulator transcription factor [Stieleria marina]|uniref:Cell cycle response regulator CtrA n=1 Tax=Stieleria marina TaxID=1930275 RepID=A0A517NYE8_9BACT|nr:Cell cycle response regulator CtrA [Planctomycetes bacterium K23_9]
MPKRILLIDDDHDILKATAMRLGSVGYDTVSNSNGAMGLKIAKSCIPDAIVLDLRMPGMTGLDVLRELKSSSEAAAIPIVVVSASLIDQQAALDGGANYFVKKPYNGAQLIEVIDAAIHESDSGANSVIPSFVL